MYSCIIYKFSLVNFSRAYFENALKVEVDKSILILESMLLLRKYII